MLILSICSTDSSAGADSQAGVVCVFGDIRNVSC